MPLHDRTVRAYDENKPREISTESGTGFLKCCFHAHTQERNPYTPLDLLYVARKQGYDVLAVTEHDQVYFTDEMRKVADDIGITLLPGIETSIGPEKSHVIIVNTQRYPDTVKDISDLRYWLENDVDRRQLLVVAPHPYYLVKSCLGDRLIDNIDLFDAVEFSYFRSPVWGDIPNRRAIDVAQRFDKPVLGVSDVHRLWHLETTYTMLRSDRTPESVINAVKSSRFDDCCIGNNSNGHHNTNGRIVIETRYLGLGEITDVVKMGLMDMVFRWANKN